MLKIYSNENNKGVREISGQFRGKDFNYSFNGIDMNIEGQLSKWEREELSAELEELK